MGPPRLGIAWEKNLGAKYGETIWVSEIGNFDVISAYKTYDFIQG
jgi:hypothetical protein